MRKRVSYIRVNQRIRLPRLRVIDEDGKQLGIISRDEALRIAGAKELDLVEIGPNEKPPICKIMDYGKYMYEKKQKEKKQKRGTIKIKEIKLGAKIQEHDYLIKLKSAREFLSLGNRVKIRLFFRGREITHKDRGREILERMTNDLSDISEVEVVPKMEGRQMTTQLVSTKRG